MPLPIDIVFLVILGVSIVIGIWRGFVFEALTLLSWVLAFAAALWWSPYLIEHLPLKWPIAVREAISFALIFLLAIFICGGGASLMRKFVGVAGLSVIDRGLGFLFGCARGCIVLLVLTEIVGLTPLSHESWWMKGVGPQLTEQTLSTLKPWFSNLENTSSNSV